METLKAVEGFKTSSLHVGFKKSALDLGLIWAPKGAFGAAVFTQNLVVAAPVTLSRKYLFESGGDIHAVLVNSGNANAATGEKGVRHALASAEALARELGIEPKNTLIASTGVIGVELDSSKITSNLSRLISAAETSDESFKELSKAIITTDLVTKTKSAQVEIGGETFQISGIAKGSGMVKPNMATVLGFILTDAPLSSATCEAMLKDVAVNTFNAITVDGDTSTNDTLALLASKVNADSAQAQALNTPGSKEYETFLKTLFRVAESLARSVAKDGEGATKLLEVIVSGAASSADAKRIAYTIAESMLVKTAMFGRDANWGRVAAAAGRAGADIKLEGLNVAFGHLAVCEGGSALPFDEDEALEILSQDTITILCEAGMQPSSKEAIESARTHRPMPGTARVLSCDLTYEYVRINGEYRS